MARIIYIDKVRKMTTETASAVNVHSIAKTFLNFEPMTPKKLQKLCYYAYSWYLALNDKRLFDNNFQAWIHGPVDPDLYNTYKSYGWSNIEREQYIPSEIGSDPELLEFIEEVYESYGDLDGNQLEYLTHRESPWLNARGDLKPYEPSNNELSDYDISTFYKKELGL